MEMKRRRTASKMARPAGPRDLTMERLQELAAVVTLEHNYSCIPDTALKKRHVKNAAVLPALRPPASVSSGEMLCQLEEPLIIHGKSVHEYQDIYSSVVRSVSSGRCLRRFYSPEHGLGIKQQLWKKLDRPVLLETEGPDGQVFITETRSRRRIAPRITVDISMEP